MVRFLRTVVSRPFTFTVAAGQTCGSQVIASLQLQDGATNLGTVTYTYQVGTFGGSVTATYSSGNIAVPLPDQGTADVPIIVSDLGGVADINVKVRLNHTFDGDVQISLVAPDNTTVPLAAAARTLEAALTIVPARTRFSMTQRPQLSQQVLRPSRGRSSPRVRFQL